MSDDKAPPTKLYTALLAAMKVCGPVKKNASNPAFRTKYADLQSVLDTIEGPLWDHGLLIVQRFGYDTEQAVLFTEVIHAESGERITSMIPVVSKDPHDPQKMGGAITYYRRYSLLALLGLAPEDDDGNAASKPPQRQQEQPPRPPANAYSASNMYSPTPPAAPAPSGPHPLLAVIRDDDADPKKRETALHNYMMTATSLAALADACTIAERAGIPEATLDRARAWHNERIMTGKPPAPKAQPASYAG